MNLPVDAYDRSGATKIATGKVLTVDNQIDQSTGTVRIKAIFDNKDHLLFPSQFVNVQLDADLRKDQVVVPNVAVQHGPSGTPLASFIYVIQNGKAVSTPVTVGVVQGDRASIDKGITVGDVVVTDSTDRLRDGSKIEVRTPGAPAPAAAARAELGSARVAAAAPPGIRVNEPVPPLHPPAGRHLALHGGHPAGRRGRVQAAARVGAA